MSILGSKLIHFDYNILIYQISLIAYNILKCLPIFIFRCRGNTDDTFRPCFECHTTDPRKSFGWGGDNPAWNILQQRYERDRFRATKRKSRIICSKTAKNGHSCRIRTSRAIEFRAVSYIRVLRFIQKEQYLTKEDIDIFQYFQSYIP